MKLYTPLMLVMLLSFCSQKKAENNDFTENDDKTACEQLDEIDRVMLDLIEEIKEKKKDDKLFLTAFKDAQIYWIQYRNRQVKAVFPMSPNKYDYNVGECKCAIYRDLTLLRVEELKRWTKETPYTEDCPGTIQ